jgi:hypothetical protein
VIWSLVGGGTLDQTGLYRAPTTTGGTALVIARAGSKADTARVTIVAGGGTLAGKPFGPSGLLAAPAVEPFTYAATEAANQPEVLLEKVQRARERGVALILSFPCGAHTAEHLGHCLSVIDGVPKFDRTRWTAALAGYDRPDVIAAILAAHRDGFLVGLNILDEPWVTGSDDGSGVVVGNTWGPKGWMTKALVDALCAEVGALFPGVPAGTSDHLTSWEPTKDYRVCDFGIFQYSARFGPLTTWRDGALARVRRGGYAASFSFNPINGGTQDRDGTWDCAAEGGVRGQSAPNCSMTEPEIVAAGTALGETGCGGLMMWRYDASRFDRADWRRAFTRVAELQRARQPHPCLPRRP